MVVPMATTAPRVASPIPAIHWVIRSMSLRRSATAFAICVWTSPLTASSFASTKDSVTVVKA